MAFKTVKSYNQEKFGGLFLLRNDGDYADVIFLYSSEADVLVADAAHYVKSSEYSGYVHCCGAGCPACSKNIRVQSKLFIPLYNLTANDGAGEIQFWDRTMRFEPQLHQDVFANFPNPSEIVFRVTRHGVANDVSTTYEIQAIGRNTSNPLSKILSDNHISFPDYYNTICKDLRISELSRMLNTNSESTGYSEMPSYQVTPRSVNTTPQVEPEIPVAPAIPNIDITGSVDESVVAPIDANEEIDDVTF